MKFKSLAIALCASALMLPTFAAPADEKAATAAALSWLGLVDKGQYKKSWEQAASYFKANVKQGAWDTQIKGVRTPLGKVLKRTVKVTQYATSLPGAPDGEYVVIQFDTQFEKKAAAVETITPMKDKGAWKVSGYFIK